MTTPSVWHLGNDHPLHRLGRRALLVGGAGAAVSAAGAITNPTQFLHSFLVAYLFAAGAALGCLVILMLQYVTGGAWGAAIRRPLESGIRTLPLIALLFIPIAFGIPTLYEWARPEALHDQLLVHKRPYLNVPFFLARSAFYFTCWITIAHFLTRWSQEQDATGAR